MTKASFILEGPPMRGRCPCGVDLDRMLALGYYGHACGRDFRRQAFEREANAECEAEAYQ